MALATSRGLVILTKRRGGGEEWRLFAYFLLKATNVLLFQGYVNNRLSAIAATVCVRVYFKLSVRRRVLRFLKRKGFIMR